MENTQKFLIGAIVLLLLLNIATLVFVLNSTNSITGAAVTSSNSLTEGSVVIEGKLAEDSELNKCCDVGEKKGCYVTQGSGCSACNSVCE